MVKVTIPHLPSPMPKPKKKIKTKPNKPGYRVQNVEEFYVRSDWAQLWEKWYLSVNPDGGWKYARLWEFIKDVTDTEEQHKFLWWYLGPKEDKWDTTPEAKKYSFVQGGPVDWVKRRDEGGWFNNQTVEAMKRELTRRLNTYDKLMATSSYAITFLERAVRFADRIDKEFRHTFFVPGLSASQNEARAKLYIKLQQDLLDYFNSAHDRYAKTLGVNFDDMAGLTNIMAAAALAVERDAAAGNALTEEQKALKSVVEMTLIKFGKHKINLLPEDAEAKIVEATAERVESKKTKPN